MPSFVLANANGLHETQMFPDKPRRFLQHILNANADFAFVTETRFTPESNPWKLTTELSSPHSAANNVAVPSSPPGRGNILKCAN